MSIKILRIPDLDGNTDYDSFVVIPDGMKVPVVRNIVDKAITYVKALNPDEYLFEDLETELKKANLVIAKVYKTNQSW
jgi:hypothetical protein